MKHHGTLAGAKIRPDVGDLLKAKVRQEVDKHKRMSRQEKAGQEVRRTCSFK